MLQLSLPACRSPILRHLFLNQFPLITRCMLEAYAAALIFSHSSYACILKWVNPLSSFVSVHTSFFLFSLSLSLLPPYLHFFSFLNLLFWSPYLFSIFLTNFFLFFFFSFTCLTLYLSSHYLFFTSFFSSHIAWLDISHSASSPFFFLLTLHLWFSHTYACPPHFFLLQRVLPSTCHVMPYFLMYASNSL